MRPGITENSVPNDYSSKWKEYKSRVRVFFISWFIPGLILALLDYHPIAHCWISKVPDNVIMLIIGAIFVGSFLRICCWRCPRCRKYFFVGNILLNLWAQRCLHCSLPKWAQNGPSK